MRALVQEWRKEGAWSNHWSVAVLKSTSCRFPDGGARSCSLGTTLCPVSSFQTLGLSTFCLIYPISIRPQPTQAAVTKYHRLGGTNNRCYFCRLRSLRSGASIVRFGENFLPILKMASQRPHLPIPSHWGLVRTSTQDTGAGGRGRRQDSVSST